MYESDAGSASLVLHHAVGSQLFDGAVQKQWVSKYDVRPALSASIVAL